MKHNLKTLFSALITTQVNNYDHQPNINITENNQTIDIKDLNYNKYFIKEIYQHNELEKLYQDYSSKTKK